MSFGTCLMIRLEDDMFSGMNYVYEVYKERSFSKAAENLYISQPSLSAMIKKIETKVGVPLFDRSTTPIQLTEYGKKYIKTAEKIMDLEDDFAYFTENLNELKTGRLSIGGPAFFTSFVLPEPISKFRQLYPQVKVNIVEDQSNHLEQKVSNGDLDIVLDNYQVNKELYEQKVFMEEHLILAVPTSYTSNRRATRYQLNAEDIRNDVHLNSSFPGIPLKKFADEPFIALRSPNDTRKRMEAICQSAGVKLNMVLKLDQLLTTYHLAEYGMGAAFVSDTIIKYLPPTPNLIYYKLDDPNAVRNINIYYRKHKYLTRSMSEFIKIALSEKAPSQS